MEAGRGAFAYILVSRNLRRNQNLTLWPAVAWHRFGPGRSVAPVLFQVD